MSDRRDTGELDSDSASTTVAESGRCTITATCRLMCVAPDGIAIILVDFEEGEEHGYDRLEWKNKGGGIGTGYVVRTGDGDAHLMPHLWERWCRVVGQQVTSRKVG